MTPPPPLLPHGGGLRSGLDPGDKDTGSFAIHATASEAGGEQVTRPLHRCAGSGCASNVITGPGIQTFKAVVLPCSLETPHLSTV